jgi:uncharacterized protein
MRLIILVLAILLRALPMAQAQDAPSPEALAAARDLMAVMSPDMVGQMTRAMTAQVWPNIEQGLGGKIDQATLGELRGEFEHVIEQFATDSLKDAPAIYAKYFSVQELRDIAAFYKTPVGAKSLQTMPQVMSEYFRTVVPRMAELQRDFEGRMRAILQKHGYSNP